MLQMMWMKKHTFDMLPYLYVYHVIVLCKTHFIFYSLQRNFAQVCKSDDEVKYQSFREWLDGAASITEEHGGVVMNLDEEFDYTTLGVGRSPAVASEINVYTSSSAGDLEENATLNEENSGSDAETDE